MKIRWTKTGPRDRDAEISRLRSAIRAAVEEERERADAIIGETVKLMCVQCVDKMLRAEGIDPEESVRRVRELVARSRGGESAGGKEKPPAAPSAPTVAAEEVDEHGAKVAAPPGYTQSQWDQVREHGQALIHTIASYEATGKCWSCQGTGGPLKHTKFEDGKRVEFDAPCHRCGGTGKSKPTGGQAATIAPGEDRR